MGGEQVPDRKRKASCGVLGSTLRVMEARRVRSPKGTTTQAVIDSNREVVTWRVESGTFPSFCKSFQQRLMLFFVN